MTPPPAGDSQRPESWNVFIWYIHTTERNVFQWANVVNIWKSTSIYCDSRHGIICSRGRISAAFSLTAWSLRWFQWGTLPNTALHFPFSIPRLLWRISSLWRAAIAGCCRRLCQHGWNLRPPRPSCSCAWIKNQSSSAIKQSVWRLDECEMQHKAFLVLFILKLSYITVKQTCNERSEVVKPRAKKKMFSLLSLNKTSVICVIMISCRGITVVNHVSGRLQCVCVAVVVWGFFCSLLPCSHTSPLLWLTWDHF